MKKKLLLMIAMIAVLVCLFAISASAEAVYVNSNGEQVSADDTDIAYEIEIENPWDTGGGCRIKYIYLYDSSVTKIVIPEIELVNSSGTVYKMAEYSYVKLSTGWGSTLSVYALDDKDTKANSLHTQIKEMEFYVPVFCDGAGSQGNLAGWSGLEKLSFYSKAYETQNKGGFLSGCTSLKEIHFYAENNELTSNFFPSTMVAGGIVVFHEGATGTICSCGMQNLNGKDITVYMNMAIQPKDSTDPRLTWNKNGNGLLKFVLLVNDKSGYTDEQIASYETSWQAGNNKNASNATYSMPIMTYCEYYGNHPNMSVLSSCVSKCLTCNEIEASENPVHNVDITIQYTDYAAVGTKTTKCLNEGCPLNVEPSVEEAPALFTCLGYSHATDAIMQAFQINKDAIEKYMTLSGKDVKYGILAASGNVANIYSGGFNDKVINVDFTNRAYDIMEMKIYGIGEAHYATELYCCGYILVDGEIIYMDDGMAEEATIPSKVTYNSIANKAVVLNTPETTVPSGDEEEVAA